jgi:hypothetical protein
VRTVKEVLELATPLDKYPHLCRHPLHEPGELIDTITVVPINRVRHHVNGKRRHIVMFGLAPMGLARTIPKCLFLIVFTAMTAQDRAIAVSDNGIEQLLEKGMAGGQIAL